MVKKFLHFLKINISSQRDKNCCGILPKALLLRKANLEREKKLSFSKGSKIATFVFSSVVNIMTELFLRNIRRVRMQSDVYSLGITRSTASEVNA